MPLTDSDAPTELLKKLLAPGPVPASTRYSSAPGVALQDSETKPPLTVAFRPIGARARAGRTLGREHQTSARVD